jgi:hypothetical protein
MMKRLAVTVLAVLGVVAFLPANAAASPTAPAELRMAAAGIDLANLKPGYVVNGYEIVWGDRDAVMYFGRESDRAVNGVHDCPTDYACLFENSNFDDQNGDGVRDGRRIVALKGRDVWHNLGAWYDFDNKMSSWVNKGVHARWYWHDWRTPTPNECMYPWFSYDVAKHAPSWNDQASTLWIYQATVRPCAHPNS